MWPLRLDFYFGERRLLVALDVAVAEADDAAGVLAMSSSCVQGYGITG